MDFKEATSQLCRYENLLCGNYRWDDQRDTVQKILAGFLKVDRLGPESMKRTATQLAGRTLQWCGMTESSLLHEFQLEVDPLSENDKPPHDPIQLEQIPSKPEALVRLGRLMQLILDVLELMLSTTCDFVSLSDVEGLAKQTQKYVEREGHDGKKHAENEMGNTGPPPLSSMEYRVYVAKPAATRWEYPQVDLLDLPSRTLPPERNFNVLNHQQGNVIIYNQIRISNSSQPHPYKWVPYAASCDESDGSHGIYDSFTFVLERQRPPQIVYQQPKQDLAGALIRFQSNGKTPGRQAMEWWLKETV